MPLMRHGLARQDRFLYRHCMRLQKAQISRHLVASLEHDDVAGHQCFRGDAAAFAVANHRGLRCQQAPDRVHRRFRLSFLDEADRGVRDDDGEDDDRVEPFTEQRSNDRAGEQHVDQDVVKLHEHAGQQSAARRFTEAVRAVTLQPCLRLAVVESHCGRVDSAEYGFPSLEMPVRLS
jgi:hypothetical protein